MQNSFRLLLRVLPLAFLSACGTDLPPEVEASFASLPDRVDFNQHVRPILSDRCWSCHGPDEASRKAGLRLDTERGAFAALTSGNGHAIRPGNVGGSLAIDRMTETDPELLMPPPESQLTVSPREIALIARWVKQGAEWKDHWAFLPIEKPTSPANPAGYVAANSIDQFINDRLRREGLNANARADDERLLRRVYLDLTGLPPGPEAMDTWLANPTDEAYAAVVDRLLGTEAHAERLAMPWLDLARYADSHGMHADGYRTAWPYRDWVLQAIKANMPYDRFIREQVAGDLIPEATRDQKIASAFNRMHPMTAEGGAIDEEMRLTYVFDRVNTVATGMLGLTMDCSRCHDHKFDPLSQEEYYGFSAFFNNFRELGMVGDDGDYGPYLVLADSVTRARLDDYADQLGRLRAARSEVTVSKEELTAFLAKESVRPPRPDHHVPFERLRGNEDGQRVDAIAWGTNELRLVEDEARGTVAEFDHPYDDVYLDEGHAQYATADAWSASLWLKTTKRDPLLTQTLLGTAGHKNDGWRGSEFYLDAENRLNFRLIRTMPDDALHVRTKDSIRMNQWTQVALTYDGSGRAGGARLFIDGRQPEQLTLVDNLRGEASGGWRKMRIAQAYREFTGENGIFLGRLDEVAFFDRALTPLEVLRLVDPEAQADEQLATAHLLLTDADYAKTMADLRTVKAEQTILQDTLRRLMVSEEPEDRFRATYLLRRGAYDAPGKEVTATTPAAVLPFSENLPKNRLGLVEWMLQADNPLTARVAVNRYWQMIFGRGIVATPHDFGSQGELPSHPALLDHLATDFREGGWDVRALLRRMVLSDTYRRSGTATPEQREADPDNRLLARGPTRRLPAEMIRDNALAAAGLLVEKTGGPSVRPYQPAGLWEQANNFSRALLTYGGDHGDKLYRRSMYTFNKRTSPPPFMTTFDAAVRDVCVVERSVTNTPLQALNLLNDPQFVETARVLAQRVQLEKEETGEQLAHAFRLVAGRRPRPEEASVLRRLYDDELTRFTDAPALADSLLAIGEYPVPDTLDPLKTAALASVGNVLFNYDEAYMKR